ncbi:MAG TPA: 3-hydroxybutyrate dehydrogenase [Burkholderiales bacterium]|nr:3-hydroxybutyrate dehydrogenase [Burkholderiales bacterium]
MNPKGKTALVTGSTGGIGEAFARTFAQADCNVVINGFGETAAIDRFRAELESHGVGVLYHPADVGKPDDIAAMIEAAQSRFGAIDIVVNNAVTRHFAPVEEFPADKWDRALAINLSAAFHTIRLTLPGMKKRNWGRIINMASIHATNVVPHRVDYVTTKHAIVGLTRAVALEIAQTGITCNALSPGLVLTPNCERQIAAKVAEGMTREEALRDMLQIRQPSRRVVMPAEVAAFGLFLCSDTASNISGADLPIDGAWSVL